ncbi:MAG TPA: hypothetical protein VIX90_08770 [Edaphobacter sp.]
MARFLIVALSALCLSTLYAVQTHAKDLRGSVKKAIEKSTLDQPGTKPFHLKATYSPSNERDKDSHRVGEIEIWWQSPTKWRREVRSPEFHQIEIVDGAHQWQKNEGDYFPDWLRELAQAIVRPVPLSTDVLLQRVKTAEVKHMPIVKQTNIEWDKTVGFGDEQNNGKGHIALMDDTGLLFYTGGSGWDGLYHDFNDFHGLMIARTVAAGYVEVTAKIGVLENLGNIPADFFDTNAPGGDAQPIETAVLDETELRQNLLPGKPFSWPPLAQGPLEGVVWTQVVLDRTGKIREMIPPISDNAGLKDAAEQQFRTLQFRPVLRNGVPVQAIGRFAVPFKTLRPAGVESFDSARSYFDHGRKLSCLGEGASAPYILHAEFQAASSKGTVETGRYEDTWVSETQWKREVWFGSSHLVRSQNGEKHYLLSEGPEAGVLRFVMMMVEPIPASDTMTESDWRIRRDTADTVKTIRVFRGPEGPNGELEPGKSQGYWFDEGGQLVRTYTSGMEIRPLNQENYAGVQMARRIDVLKDGKLSMRFLVKDIQPVDRSVAKAFVLKGHEWQRAFTAETR